MFQSPIAAFVTHVEYFRAARDSDSVMKSPAGAYIGKGLVFVGIGVLIGLAMGLGVERLMNSMLFSTARVDIVAYVIVAPSLFLVTMLAAYVPARRASKIALTQALRYE